MSDSQTQQDDESALAKAISTPTFSVSNAQYDDKIEGTWDLISDLLESGKWEELQTLLRPMIKIAKTSSKERFEVHRRADHLEKLLQTKTTENTRYALENAQLTNELQNVKTSCNEILKRTTICLNQMVNSTNTFASDLRLPQNSMLRLVRADEVRQAPQRAGPSMTAATTTHATNPVTAAAPPARQQLNAATSSTSSGAGRGGQGHARGGSSQSSRGG